MSSETYHYKRGCNQLFQQTSHVFDPSQYSDAELAFNNNYTMFLADIQSASPLCPLATLAQSIRRYIHHLLGTKEST